MLETDEWGFRELAYRIHNERRGYYVRLDYAATGPVMNEVERNLKLSDSVLRYLSVLLDPEVDTAKVRAEIEARLHRAAEAKPPPRPVWRQPLLPPSIPGRGASGRSSGRSFS